MKEHVDHRPKQKALTLALTAALAVMSHAAMAQVSGPTTGPNIWTSGDLSVTSSGTISGGLSTTPYVYSTLRITGAGIDFGSVGTLTNTGNITGGGGGGSPYGTSPGGDAVIFAGNGDIRNSGMILGGAAYVGSFQYAGSAGGVGVDITGVGTLVNFGTILGGHGAVETDLSIGTDGNGGNGVDLNGGLLIDSGFIGGGGAATDARQGDAIYFGTAAATLVVEQGAAFDGDIVARASVNDTLVLGNATAGTFSGLGAAVTGFSTLRENTGTNWTLTASPSISAAAQVIGGTLSIVGSLADSGR